MYLYSQDSLVRISGYCIKGGDFLFQCLLQGIQIVITSVPFLNVHVILQLSRLLESKVSRQRPSSLLHNYFGGLN